MSEMPLTLNTSLSLYSPINLKGASFLTLIGILCIWEIVRKTIAMYRAARKGQKGWFVALIVLNTCGILPIIYLLTHKITNKNKERGCVKGENVI